MLTITPNSFIFDATALNDYPTYRTFVVHNISNNNVTISITPSHDSLIVQGDNENYRILEYHGYDKFCQMYDENLDIIGQISSFDMLKDESKTFVLSFRALESNFSNITTHEPLTSFDGTLKLTIINNAEVKNLSDVSMILREQKFNIEREWIIPIHTLIYKSLLEVSTSDMQFVMLPNKMQLSDITVTNRSCKSASFVIRNQSMLAKGIDLELYETEHFETPTLNHAINVGANMSIHLSLMARTSEDVLVPQEYHAELQCTNLSNFTNTIVINVMVIVTPTLHTKLIRPDLSEIKFGEIYRGARVEREIELINCEGREDINIKLSTIAHHKCQGEIVYMRAGVYVDEVLLPSSKKSLHLLCMYTPCIDSEEKNVTPVKFDLEIIATATNSKRQQRCIVKCTATLVTSHIKVTPMLLNFGDCQVGQSRKQTLEIENESPLPCTIEIHLRSKIITIDGINTSSFSTIKDNNLRLESTPLSLESNYYNYQKYDNNNNNNNSINYNKSVIPFNPIKYREIQQSFVIAPTSKLHITFRISPQRVNPLYRKQLTILNTCYATDDPIIVNIESNNVAQPEARLHNALYT